MKNSIIIALLVLSFNAKAQVAIGKNSITNTSVSLEFGDYDNANGKGIILPWVDNQSVVTGAVEGTLVFDTNDTIVKYKTDNNQWTELSKNETSVIDGVSTDTKGKVNFEIQKELSDHANAKVGIGQPTETPGILVLEDANKAMILPKVPEPHKNIVNPEPGTIVYDTTNHMVAVFNGTVWSFWKP